MTEAPIQIALIGAFALQGRERMEAALAVPHAVIPVPDSTTPERKLELIVPAQVIVGTQLTREMAERAKGLRLMHTIGAGIDQVDLAALPPGARLANVFHHGVGIAEYILMALLALPRDIARYDARLRRGDWSGSYWSNAPIPPPRPELRGKTLALLGLGTIGREVAVRTQAFGMRVLGMRRSGAAGAPVPGVDEVHGPESLEPLLRQADYVVVAIPLSPETQGLIGDRALGWMKPSAYIVNVGRGPILEEEPLYRALAEKRIAGLACDVWYVYPRQPFGDEPVFPSRFPFHELDNVLITPHISGWTEGTMNGRFRAIAENINRLCRGEPLENQVCPPPEPQ